MGGWATNAEEEPSASCTLPIPFLRSNPYPNTRNSARNLALPTSPCQNYSRPSRVTTSAGMARASYFSAAFLIDSNPSAADVSHQHND